MRRRLTFTLLGMVLATLVVAGLGTLLLARLGARQQTERDLRGQAESTAALIGASPAIRLDAITREQLTRVRRLLNLEQFSLVVVTPDGGISPVGDELPAHVTLAQLDTAKLRAGEVVSGQAGRGEVFAAAPIGDRQDNLGVLVMTRSVEPILGASAGWFVLASLATLLLAAVVAWRLARQLTKPLHEASLATSQIAAGDLTTRLVSHKPTGGDELDHLARSINQMAESLERSRGLEQQFLLSVSHDLRTPLTSIRGYAEAIADGTARDHASAAAVILAESRRLERLVRDLLDLARLEAREFTLAMQPTDARKVARETATGFSRQAAEAGLVVDQPGEDGPELVMADSDRLAQVVANLIENAIKYARSRVTVEVSRHEAWVAISISDDGAGIDPVDLPHVFERLYVAPHEPLRREIGSGLGLAIVRDLVEAMGGRVEARANEPAGTTMLVWLPAQAGGSPTTSAG